MRAANRKLNKQPVRSPSPDIAAKNKITTTNAPIAEVLQKSRIKSMHHDLSIEELQKMIIDWEEKYKMLERQFNALLLQNSGLKKEIGQLQTLLAQNRPVVPQANQQDSASLREYESRFGRMMEQMRRIQELLGRQKSKNQLLQTENMKIKSFQDNTRDNSELLHKNFSYIEQTLNLSFERMKVEHEVKTKLSFNGLAERMSKIERNLFQIKNSIAKSEFSTPKIVKELKFDENSTTPGYRSASPTDSKKFSRKSIPKEDDKEQTIELITQENSRLRQALQNERTKLLSQRECSNCPIHERRIAELEMNIETYRRQRQLASEQALANELEFQRERQTFRLQDYLRRIREVKTILNNQQFRQFVSKVNQLINENTEMHEAIQQLQEEKESILKQSKRQEAEKDMLISQLERQNEIYKGKIKAQEEHLGKLQELIKEKGSEKVGGRNQRSQNDPKIFQRYIEEAIRKLQGLQQSIETTLQE